MQVCRCQATTPYPQRSRMPPCRELPADSALPYFEDVNPQVAVHGGDSWAMCARNGAYVRRGSFFFVRELVTIIPVLGDSESGA
jgi:hypothetical protein